MGYLLVAAGAVVLALAATPLAARLGWRYRILDYPRLQSIHVRTVPRTGGIAIVAAAVLILAAAWVASGGAAVGRDWSALAAALGGGLLVAGIGLVDDKVSLRARIKLAVETLAALGVWAAGVRIESVGLEAGASWNLGWASAPVTVLWILVMVNAMNLIDGLDGLAAGIAAIACGAVGLLAIRAGQPAAAMLALAAGGSAMGFLAFNFHPARVFMGDCGSLFLGFLIGCSSIAGAGGEASPAGLAIVALAMGVPILDLTIAVLRRLLSGRSVFCPDRDHIHHRLLGRGLTQRGAALVLYAATAASAGVGLLLLTTRGVRSLGVPLCVVLLLGLVFHRAGALPFRALVQALRRARAASERSRSDRRVLREVLAHLSRAGTLESWWDGACRAAERLGFQGLCMTIETRGEEKRVLRWTAVSPPDRPEEGACVDLDLRSSDPRISLRLVCSAPAGAPADVAGRRAALLGRLIGQPAPLEPSAQRQAA